jgi:hypothetical protein
VDCTQTLEDERQRRNYSWLNARDVEKGGETDYTQHYTLSAHSF